MELRFVNSIERVELKSTIAINTKYPPIAEEKAILNQQGFRYRKYSGWQKDVKSKEELRSVATAISNTSYPVLISTDLSRNEWEERLNDFGWSGRLAMAIPTALRQKAGNKTYIVGSLSAIYDWLKANH